MQIETTTAEAIADEMQEATSNPRVFVSLDSNAVLIVDKDGVGAVKIVTD